MTHTPTPTHGFSLDVYRTLLGTLLGMGYRVADFATAIPTQADLIVRHDVDVCLNRALAMAKTEAAMGVHATYFVLLRTPLYSLLDANNLATMKEIQALGHSIGLHFDASLYPQEHWQQAIADECHVLETMLGQPVTVISFHRPAPSLMGYADLLAGRIHAYQPRFVNAMGYCSDSRGAWYHGAPLDHPAVKAKTALQLLTHPIWWDAQEHESATDKLKRLVDEKFATYRLALADNITPYREVLHDIA